MSIRPVQKISQSVPTLEGAGVHLRRAFGFGKTEDFDPFLLFDDFRGDDPSDYLKGFPWHPHRGIETITYVLAGSVEHRDSLGNHGSIQAGQIQWMTAGCGIIHQEMPEGAPDGKMHGFQLWANLPSSLKMTRPRYQEFSAPEMPEVIDDDGTRVKIICGEFWGRRGPVEGIAADPHYLDITVPAGTKRSLAIETTRHAFAYVIEGEGRFADASDPLPVPTDQVGEVSGEPGQEVENRSLVLFDQGDEIVVKATDADLRFLLASGRPLREPVAWQGPIVMNTREELQQAFAEYRQGTFLKHQA